MSPNQSYQNRNNQQNRPQQSVHVAPAAITTDQTKEAALTAQVESEPDYDYSKQFLSPDKINFKELLCILTLQILEEKITPNQARQFMHDWWRAMSNDSKAKFVEERTKADETVNHIRGVVDTLAQELPYLLANL